VWNLLKEIISLSAIQVTDVFRRSAQVQKIRHPFGALMTIGQTLVQVNRVT
jgi:hypothetical protein